MNIPTALGKLGDPRAIVLLENIIKSSITEDSDDDNDSSDGIFSSGGRNRLVIESCLALGSFIGKLLSSFDLICSLIFLF